LSSSKVTCILQEKNGVFWFGTEDGLNRFDGINFTHYKMQADDEFSLPSNHITDLYLDDGQLRVNTMNGAVSYDHLHDRFLPPESNMLARAFDFHPRLKVRHGNDGAIWIASPEDGLSVYDSANRTVRRIITPSAAMEITDIDVMPDGRLLVCTRNNGLAIYDVEKDTLLTYSDVFDKERLNAVTSATSDSHGNIYIGTDGDGIFVFDEKRRRIMRSSMLEELGFSLDKANVNSLYVGMHDYLWIGMKYDGILVVGAEESGFRSFKQASNVTSIVSDDGNNLWIASDGGGLICLDSNGKVKGRYGRDYGGLPSDAVTNLLYDSRRQLWVAAGADGLFRLDNETGRFLPYPINVHIRCMEEDASGIIWIGTDGDGLLRLNPEDGSSRIFRSRPGNGLPGDYISALLSDGNNRLWIGGNAGLGLMNTDNYHIRLFNSDNGLNRANILSIAEAPDSIIWIGSSYGLSYYSTTDETFLPAASLPKIEGIAINAIVPDDDDLWLSTNEGIMRYTTSSGAVMHYSSSNSDINGNEYITGARCKTPEGKIVFGGTDGLTYFFPNDVLTDAVMPEVALIRL
jgi:ligand-binding sensor domain-containing protein